MASQRISTEYCPAAIAIKPVGVSNLIAFDKSWFVLAVDWAATDAAMENRMMVEQMKKNMFKLAFFMRRLPFVLPGAELIAVLEKIGFVFFQAKMVQEENYLFSFI